MVRIGVWLGVSVLLVCCVLPMAAQRQSSIEANVVVPPYVNFSGGLTDMNGKPMTGVAGVTFFLYKDSQGGAPLWMETQNVYPDKSGHYSVMLGATISSGLPSDIFIAGQARWLGARGQNQDGQTRVL